MCGLAGLIDFNHTSSKKILEDCTDVLSHRGGDGKGHEFFTYQEATVGLGHRRLSIIGLDDTAAQPMPYKNWYIIFNGEIYNYKELKTELQLLGHHFNTGSDTEVILHAWEEWSYRMLDRFIGMFVFIIFDSEKKELFCFRDRAGIKPFYYYWHNGLFLFASELKSFHKHPGFNKVINKQALLQFLQYGYIMAPHSVFDHAYKLPAGNYLHFSIAERKFSIHSWWDVVDAYNKTVPDISEDEALKYTEQLLSSACEYSMVSDVPVGVFLSGGYDSTAIAASLQATKIEKLKTFTIGFVEEKYNEAPFAKKVADHLQTDHREYNCTTRDAQEIIPCIALYCDEPFGDSSIIPTMLVSRLARQEVKVALSADGGDEIFAGYKNYSVALDFAKKMNKVPSFLKGAAGNMLKQLPDDLLVQLSGNNVAPEKKNRITCLLKNGNVSVVNVMDQLLSQSYSITQLKEILNFESARAFSFFDEEFQNGSMGSLDQLQVVDFKTYLPDDILVKVDRATMSASLEGREPLLDHRLVEFVAQLPSEMKIKGADKKYLLKQIVHKYVPESIMNRPKMGFGVPVFEWLRNDLRYYADEYMNVASFEKHGLFKTEAVKAVMLKFYSGDRNYESLFWYLLVFQMWYKRWM